MMTLPLVGGEVTEDFDTKTPNCVVSTKLPISLDGIPVKLDVGDGKSVALVHFSPQQYRQR